MGTSTGASAALFRKAVVILALAGAACEQEPAAPGGQAVASVSLNPTVFAMGVGEVMRLDVIARNAVGRTLTGGRPTWTTSAAAVADVDSLGVIRARSEGRVTISAVVDGVAGSSDVTVLPLPAPEWREHSCLLSDVGAIWCWGRGGNGELGNGARRTSNLPVRVQPDGPWASVSVGASHSCALTTSGAGYCWGRGAEGQLGNGALATQAAGVRVSEPLPLRSISAGGRHGCAITAVGEARCWGASEEGQIGNGARVNASTPVRPTTTATFTRVSAGARHSCAIDDDGRAYCWGDNRQGQLGDGTTVRRLVPTLVQTSLRFTDVSAGARHTCAIEADGRPWCWGDNTQGQLGIGSLASSAVPREVKSAPGFALRSISAADTHTCGLDSAGLAYCWGDGTFGQLGNGARLLRSSPVKVRDDPFARIVAGSAHSCAISNELVAWCWGLNSFGQLGTADFTDRFVPAPVAGGLRFSPSAP